MKNEMTEKDLTQITGGTMEIAQKWVVDNPSIMPNPFTEKEPFCDMPNPFAAKEPFCDMPNPFAAKEPFCDMPNPFAAKAEK